MDFFELAKSRCTTRGFTDRKIAQADLERILSVGRVAPSACNRQPQRILVVDDESSIREMLFRALTEIQMDVTLAKNAEEAENLCKSYPFDIIFLDYILPEMNGDKLIPIIKEHLPQSKIIFISGWSSSPLKKKDLEKRVHAWIEKPFNIRQIFDCIQQLDHGSEIKH